VEVGDGLAKDAMQEEGDEGGLAWRSGGAVDRWARAGARSNRGGRGLTGGPRLQSRWCGPLTYGPRPECHV
jgi:hypothetical protein